MTGNWAPLLRELRLFVSPIADATDVTGLAARLGWNLDAATGLPITRIEAMLAAGADAAEELLALLTAPEFELADVASALPVVGRTVEAVRAVATDWHPPAGLPLDLMEKFADDLLNHLVSTWLDQHHPRVADVLAVAGLYVPARLAAAEAPITTSGGTVIRGPGPRGHLDTALLEAFLRNPVRALRDRYDTASADLTARLDNLARLLLPMLADWLRGLGLDAANDLAGELAAALPADQRALTHRMLRVGVPVSPYHQGEILPVADSYTGGYLGAGAVFVLTGEDLGRLALAVEAFGTWSGSWQVGAWQLVAEVGALAPGLVVSADGAHLADGSGQPEVLVRFGLTRVGTPNTDGQVGGGEVGVSAALALPAEKGTRVEIGGAGLSVSLVAGPTSTVLDVALSSGPSALVVEPGDGDSFLAKVLPDKGMRVPFDVTVGWNSAKGLRVTGSAGSGGHGGGLAVSLPVHLTLGPLQVDVLDLALPTSADGLAVSGTGTFRVQLGPVTAAVQRTGVEASLRFPEGGGNLGPAELALAFKPPAGIALAIEAGPVVGGGYLFFDPAKEEYAGALQLELEGIGLKAVGLLTTRMPDGSEGFSLLVIVAAEFTPIQLGFGFTLNGVGGLLGINRSVAVEALRAGIRTGALDSVLFPADPVTRATEIVATLGTIFPPTPNRHVVGPMARIGWGTPTLLTLDVGLLLELPTPVRLALLGRLRMALPTEEAAVVVVNMDVLGLIDFDRGEASVDATLYDSRIAAFALSGDMAMRARWLDRPTFALSAGGFNPRFQPPPGFPALRRLTLSLMTGDNPRIRLESYLALTSNTVQFGARLELYAAALGFSVEGMLYFDALVQLDPFGFIADMGGALALKRGDTTLMAVRVDVTLSGPAPWHARGRATFEILFFSGEISFDQRFGQPAPAVAPAPVDVAGRVEAALADCRNWTAQLPGAGRSVVSLRQVAAPDGTLLAHPLGGLSVTQRVAPLGLALERFGAAPVTDHRPLRIESVRIDDGEPLDAEGTSEHFAVAQFLDLSDDEKLSRPSFQLFDAGRAVTADLTDRDHSGLIEAPPEYEEKVVVGAPGPAVASANGRDGLRAAPAQMAPADLAAPDRSAAVAARRERTALLARVGVGPAARAGTRTTGRGRFAEPKRRLVVRDTGASSTTTDGTGAEDARRAGRRPRGAAQQERMTGANA
ncbi:DUF6603 domain-containing protein [Actinopolymorpha sp. NPDC004070]|uniref:DUF6603 domain-containing protein n=1 Tax=Actinopolymorpha sp. NPDC004070 TaxID=3154548 RepID=UPI0033B3A4B9